MSEDIFLSVGRTYTDQQEQFVAALERLLRSRGLSPRTVSRSDFSSVAPLKRISELMEQCHGTVVCAFERSRASVYLEKPGSSEERRSEVAKLPTVWNQIEAAMTYTHKKPLLVVVEHGLKSEGLLEAGFDWYVQWIDLSEAALGTVEFQAVLSDWCSRVESAVKDQKVETSTPKDAKDLTINRLLREMPIAQVWAVVAALITVVAVVATIAYQAGQASG